MKRRKKRIIRILALSGLFAGLLIYSVYSYRAALFETALNRKIGSFSDGRISVEIGDVVGGLLTGITVKDIALSLPETLTEEAFLIESVHSPYRLWEILPSVMKDKIFREEQRRFLDVRLSDENPLLRGEFFFESTPDDKMRMGGEIALVVFGDLEKYPVDFLWYSSDKGYAYRFDYDGREVFKGAFDPSNQVLELTSSAAEDNGSLQAYINMLSQEEFELYLRVDQMQFRKKRIIGDFWLNVSRKDDLIYRINAENLVYSNKPVLPLEASGSYEVEAGKIMIDSLRWGELLFATGSIAPGRPSYIDLEIEIEALQLEEGKELLDLENDMRGSADMKVQATGELPDPQISCHLHIGSGLMGNVNFNSFFASLSGRWPVLRVQEGRMAKGAGALRMDGEIDLTKLTSDDFRDDLEFFTDHRVAVWDDWHISKWEETGTVEARRRNFIFSTRFDDETTYDPLSEWSDEGRELRFEYRLDGPLSLRMDFEEDRDFFGVEHKVEF